MARSVACGSGEPGLFPETSRNDERATEMNIAKLKKLKKWILDEPRRYCQNYWLCGPDSDVVVAQEPPCGTAGCLAGNICLMDGLKFPKENTDSILGIAERPDGKVVCVRTHARKTLGLTPRQANRLFNSDCEGWPKEAANLYHSAGGDLDMRAKAAAIAIDALIETSRQRHKAPKRRKVAD